MGVHHSTKPVTLRRNCKIADMPPCALEDCDNDCLYEKDLRNNVKCTVTRTANQTDTGNEKSLTLESECAAHRPSTSALRYFVPYWHGLKWSISILEDDNCWSAVQVCIHSCLANEHWSVALQRFLLAECTHYQRGAFHALAGPGCSQGKRGRWVQGEQEVHFILLSLWAIWFTAGSHQGWAKLWPHSWGFTIANDQNLYLRGWGNTTCSLRHKNATSWDLLILIWSFTHCDEG